jgi:integrase
MIGRRKSPDGMPFRLYERIGKFKVSYGYKLPDGTWAFRLTAPVADVAARARIRTEAVDRANVLNGAPLEGGATEALFRRYFAYQCGLPLESEDRKAESTLHENETNEAPRLLLVFGKMKPSAIKPVHIYKYLDLRAAAGAPAKANKEIALLSAVLEFGRRKGELELNPCREIKYNKTRPDTRYVTPAELDLVMQTARERGGMYVIAALCLRAAYLTVSRPDEMRQVMRQSITASGMEMLVGKRKKGRAPRFKLIEWSSDLRAVIDEALALQRTTSLYVFGNSDGQPYTISGWNTNLRRLMEHTRKRAEKEGVEFTRFTLKDMRPAAVTDRMEEGDETITNATGHSSDRMVKQTYDRRKTKAARATE